jgi:hypothetical protein
MTPQTLPDIPDLEPWFAPSVRLSSSGIHGAGIVVDQPIPAGGHILRLGGYLLDHRSHSDPRVLRSTSVGVAESVVLCQLAGLQRDLSDYLNHSCDPSAGFLDAVTVVAARDLTVGEEVTVDYAYWELDDTWILRSMCMCGAASCRAIVSGSDWKNAQIRDRLLQFAMPFVRRRILAQSKT